MLHLDTVYDTESIVVFFYFTSPHVACMTLGPKKRNLDGQSKNARERYIVCVRWNYIKEDIIDFKNSCDGGGYMTSIIAPLKN